MFLVAGGYALHSYNLLSTEIMVVDGGNWKTGGELPSSRRDLVAISLNSEIFVTGINYFTENDFFYKYY